MSAQNSTPNAKGSRRPRAQQLGTLAQKVLEPVIARRAGMNFELMAAWPDVIGPPYGPEMVIALASRAPLFPEPRPQSETERDFLTALRKALLWKADPAGPDRQVSASVVSLVTGEN